MSNQNTVLLPSTKVEGNITSCKVENEQIAYHKDSVFSLQAKTTYQSYDVCTKEVLQEYTVPEFTFLGSVLMVPFILLCLIVVFGVYVHFAEKNDKRKGTYGDRYSHL